jgi:hypothetical protein
VAEAKRLAERESQGELPIAYEIAEEGEGGGDLLSSKDQDVIF